MTAKDANDPPVLLALDWGTSALRAYLLDKNGAIRQSRESADGILNVKDGDFESAFERITGPWRQTYSGLVTIASGMIGSRQGWLETPYLDCPADCGQLAQKLSALRTATGQTVWLAPGVCYRDANGVPDVMRGEETQIFGQLGDGDNKTDRLFILPGTHSKWVFVGQGRITRFVTFMSGELFALLRKHSILGRLMRGHEHDPASFARGVAYAMANARARGGLLKSLFSARTLGLFSELPETGISAYLSGLIIANEVIEGLRYLDIPVRENQVSIIGNSALCQLYGETFRQMGGSALPGAENAVARGLFQIATAAELITP